MYAVKYRDADLISGKLLAAAELRQVIIYNHLIFFSLREIRVVAMKIYKHLKDYYDAKAECIKRVLGYRPRVHERFNMDLLCEMFFNIDGVEDMVFELVEQLSRS